MCSYNPYWLNMYIQGKSGSAIDLEGGEMQVVQADQLMNV